MKNFIILASLFLAGCASVSPGEMAITHTLGAVSNDVKGSGVYLCLPVIQHFVSYSARQQVHQEDLDNLTKDLQSLHTTVTVKYTLNSANLPSTYKTIAASNEGVYNNSIRPVVLSTFKSSVSQHELSYIADNWQRFADGVESSLKERLQKENVVTVDSVELTGMQLDPDYAKAIEEKQIAQQRLAKSKTEVEIAEQENLRNQKLQSSLTDKMLMKQLIEKWNGKSTLIFPNTNTQVLLQK